jgi:hypothetical protein
MALAIEKDVTPPNLASLVLLVEENGSRVLLTGDAGDESLLEYFEAAGLMDADGRLEVGVLKVPHHGADNGFSDEFVERVRAANYVFRGDGEHHNPEPDVVEGYLRAVQAKPLGNGPIQFWFNWSASRATKHLALWKEIEGKFKAGTCPRTSNDGLLEKTTRASLWALLASAAGPRCGCRTWAPSSPWGTASSPPRRRSSRR